MGKRRLDVSRRDEGRGGEEEDSRYHQPEAFRVLNDQIRITHGQTTVPSRHLFDWIERRMDISDARRSGFCGNRREESSDWTISISRVSDSVEKLGK